MNRNTSLAVAAAVTIVLSACASTPKPNNDLEMARTAVQQVENLPDAGKYAAAEVSAAHEALREAEKLTEQKKSTAEIQQSAYLAKRHADIATEQIAKGQAEEKTAAAAAERQKVMLQAREQEALAAKAAADAAAVAAASAAAAAKRQNEMLEAQLRELQAKQTDRGLVLTLGDVLFDTGKATLKPGASSTIDRLAAFLQEASDRSVTIEGHTDSVGSDELNMSLSQSRADGVKAALVNKGVSADRIMAVGKGESTPVAGNENPGGRQQNRRVEIIIANPPAVARGS